MKTQLKISNKQVLEFIEKVKNEFKPVKFYLFGSQAKNSAMNYSDYDFLIVSKAFEGLSFRDRIDKVLSLIEKAVGCDVEPLCYTEKEFNERKNGLNIINEAVKTGISLI